MKAAMKETKAKPGAINEESLNKVKKVQAQLVNLSRELEEEKKKSGNLEKALTEESKLKNQFEVENSRNVGVVTILKEMMEKGKTSSRGMEKRKEKCRDFEKHGNCNRGEKCAFLHPGKRCQSFLHNGCSNNQCVESHYVAGRISPNKEPKGDCSYWMDNGYKFGSERCGRIHDPAKKGSRKSDFPSRSSGLEQSLSKTQLEQIAAIVKGGQAQQYSSQVAELPQLPAMRQMPVMQPAFPQQQQIMSAPQQQPFSGQQQMDQRGQQVQTPMFAGQQQQQNTQFSNMQGDQRVASQGAVQTYMMPSIQQAGWTSTSQPGAGGSGSWM